MCPRKNLPFSFSQAYPAWKQQFETLVLSMYLASSEVKLGKWCVAAVLVSLTGNTKPLVEPQGTSDRKASTGWFGKLVL